MGNWTAYGDSDGRNTKIPTPCPSVLTEKGPSHPVVPNEPKPGQRGRGRGASRQWQSNSSFFSEKNPQFCVPERLNTSKRGVKSVTDEVVKFQRYLVVLGEINH